MIRRIAVVTFLFVAPTLAMAQQPAKTPAIKHETAKMTKSNDGAEMYQSYCAVCHGKTGKGDGPAVPALKTKPTDLTQIAKQHGGEISAKDFEDKVTGKNMSPAHGAEDMPMWGPVFKTLGNDTLRLYNVRKYVETLQTK
jgi:mono/diheme cytochrome c family protein